MSTIEWDLFRHGLIAGVSLPGPVLDPRYPDGNFSPPPAPSGPHKPARRCLQRCTPAMPIHDWCRRLSAQAPASQPMNAAEGSRKAICISFSACTSASSPAEALLRQLRLRNGAVEGHGSSLSAYRANREAGILPFWAFALWMEGITVFDSEFERNLFDLRKAKLEEIVKLGQAAYPNQFPASHTVPAGARQVGRGDGRGSGSQPRDGGRGRAHHGHPRAGQGRLRHPPAGRPAAANLRPPGRRRRAGLCALQAARPGRPHRRIGLPLPHAHRRADHPRRAADLPGQGHAGAAGEVSRPGRRGAALPPALRGPLRQPRQPAKSSSSAPKCSRRCASSSTSAATWKSRRR